MAGAAQGGLRCEGACAPRASGGHGGPGGSSPYAARLACKSLVRAGAREAGSVCGQRDDAAKIAKLTEGPSLGARDRSFCGTDAGFRASGTLMRFGLETACLLAAVDGWTRAAAPARAAQVARKGTAGVDEPCEVKQLLGLLRSGTTCACCRSNSSSPVWHRWPCDIQPRTWEKNKRA